MKYAISDDKLKIAYESSNEKSSEKETILLFVHGWLGNKSWWNQQRDFLQDQYQIIQMDLGGHGDSDKTRKVYSGELYASDIIAVAKNYPNKKIILVGHSMSGIYATMAALKISNIKGIILVDTLKNLDFSFDEELINQMMQMYDDNFEFAVKNILPQYLFSPQTPAHVREELQNVFLSQSSFAGSAIEAFYKADVRSYASLINVPVRAINAEVPPTDKITNLKYFKDFDYTSISNVGHYPMLEAPQEFNEKLVWAIEEIL